MIEQVSILVFLIPSAALLFASILSTKPNNLLIIKKIGLGSMLLSTAMSITAGFLIFDNGPMKSPLFGYNNLGFSLQLNTTTTLLFGMISAIGYAILKFSKNYLQGDSGHHYFLGRLSLTLSSVLLFVLSGNILLLFLSWVSMSFALHQLLLFYPNRKKAQIAGRKKFIAARIGDVFFFISLTALYYGFQTGDLNDIYFQIQSSTDLPQIHLEVAAIFLVLAAIMKSAQFPFHGWLVEVMETPTPVSATLHAGLINAGPFLIISMSHVVHNSMIASAILVVVGGISAIFGAISFTTQPAQKTALAYSSIAHMGFSLLTSGLGLYAAAALHLIAHSFYKGHAFLSSGTAVKTIKMKKIPVQSRAGNLLKITLGIATSGCVFMLTTYIWAVDFSDNFGFLTLSIISASAITLLIVSAIDVQKISLSLAQALSYSLILYNSFFALELGMHHLLMDSIAESNSTTVPQWLMIALLVVFLTIIVAQIISPLIPKNKFIIKMGIHFRNGLYLNTYTDKALGNFRKKSKKSQLKSPAVYISNTAKA